MWYILYFILNPAVTNQIDGIANSRYTSYICTYIYKCGIYYTSY